MMNNVTVAATKWALGWELELDSGGVTQVRSLGMAAQQVRDYLDTIDPETDHTSWSIAIVPTIGPAFDKVREAKVATEAAKAATIQAAQQMRQAVRELHAAGLSITDMAAVLDLSKGRVSQLMAA